MSQFSIDLETNQISTTKQTSVYFKNSSIPLVLLQEYMFDSINNDIDDNLSDWIVYNSIDQCIKHKNLYRVECEPYSIRADNICFVNSYIPIAELTHITSKLLYQYRADYTTLIAMSGLYPNIRQELRSYFQKYLIDCNIDLLLLYLNWYKDQSLFDILLNKTDTITNIEALAKLPCQNQKQLEQKLSYIDSVIERQDLRGDDIVDVLSYMTINPLLYIDRIDTDLQYFELATSYSILRDVSRITTESTAFKWAYTIGNTDDMESLITSSEYAYKFGTTLRKTEHCRSLINTSEDAYKWAYSYPEDISIMKSIVLYEAVPFICTLFAANIERVEYNSTEYNEYKNIVFTSTDNKSLYHWSNLFRKDEDEISDLLYANPDTYDNQGWIVSFVRDNPTLDVTPNLHNLFDKVTHPYWLYVWALNIGSNISSCKSQIINYSGSDDISQVAYEWTKTFGYDANIVSKITNTYWKLKTEYVIRTLI